MAKKKSKKSYGHVRLSNDLVRSGNALPAKAHRVFAVIKSYNPSFPSLTRIQHDSGLSRATVVSARNILVNAKIISYKQGNRFGNANEYTVKPEEQWNLAGSKIKPAQRKLNQSENKTTKVQKLNQSGKKNKLSQVQELNSKYTKKHPNGNTPNKNTNNSKRKFPSEVTDEMKNDVGFQLFQEFKALFKEHTDSNHPSSGISEANRFTHSINELGRSVEEIRKVMKNYFRNSYYVSYSVSGLLSDNAYSNLVSWKPRKKDIQEFYMQNGVTLSAEIIAMPLSKNTIYQGRLHKVKDKIAKLKEAKYVAALQQIRRHKVDSIVEKYIETFSSKEG